MKSPAHHRSCLVVWEAAAYSIGADRQVSLAALICTRKNHAFCFEFRWNPWLSARGAVSFLPFFLDAHSFTIHVHFLKEKSSEISCRPVSKLSPISEVFHTFNIQASRAGSAHLSILPGSFVWTVSVLSPIISSTEIFRKPCSKFVSDITLLYWTCRVCFPNQPAMEAFSHKSGHSQKLLPYSSVAQ